MWFCRGDSMLLFRGPCSTPSTHKRLLTAAVSPAPGYILHSSGLHGYCPHMNMFIHRNSYLHIIQHKKVVNPERENFLVVFLRIAY